MFKGFLIVAATALISATSLRADTIISVTGEPGLSDLIDSDLSISISWSQSISYTGVSIAVVLEGNSSEPPMDAYLTTQIGPGTTVADEIAHAQFIAPLGGTVCPFPDICGSIVTLFPDLSLRPGNYFLTLASTATRAPSAWFPALNPTVVEDTGVTYGGPYFANTGTVASYAPASVFVVEPQAENYFLIVTGTPTTPVPEPVAAALVGLGVLSLLVTRLWAFGRAA